MKKEDIQALFQNFEDAVCTIDDTECWSARDMQKLLGYSLWQNFTNVISKAKAACENVGQPVPDHFIDVNKMIMAGKGARREVDDVMLTWTTMQHVDNNAAVRKMLTERGIIPENLPPAEDVKKVERRLASESKKMLKGRKCKK